MLSKVFTTNFFLNVREHNFVKRCEVPSRKKIKWIQLRTQNHTKFNEYQLGNIHCREGSVIGKYPDYGYVKIFP